MQQRDSERPRSKTPTTLHPDAVKELSGALNLILADFFARYLKTKNFHWHVSGPHFATTTCSLMIRPANFLQ